MAQIQLHQGNYVSAQQSLEVGLSYNFEVRDHPLFHLVKVPALIVKKYDTCAKDCIHNTSFSFVSE
jgi:tetratricopeptide repeat protein 21B